MENMNGNFLNLSIAELIYYFENMKIKLWVEGESLRYKAPAGTVTKDLLKCLTERKLEIIEYLNVKNSGGILCSSIQKIQTKEFYPLSGAQRRMFLLSMIDSASTAYNLTQALKIDGEIDKEQLHDIFAQLIDRHESLRTSFEMLEGNPIQKINQKIDFKMDYQEITNNSAAIARTIKEFIRPYDLSKAPLFRLKLIKLLDSNSAHQYLLIQDMHHIISDGVSEAILVKEVNELFAGKSLPEVKIQYKDFVTWHTKLLESNEMQLQKQFWVEKLKNEIPLLNFPTDYARPQVFSFEGDSVKFQITKGLSDNLYNLARENRVTLFTVLFAAYSIVLSKYTAQNDIIIGTPTAGRKHADLSNVIGVFINTLALRISLEPEKSFYEFLKSAGQEVLKAFDNQDYPFEQLVEELHVQRDLSRNPIFDAMFILQNMNVGDIKADGLDISRYDFDKKMAQFDISIIAIENRDGIEIEINYCTSIFKKETIEKFRKHFINTLNNVVENVNIKIQDIDMLSDEEKDLILYKFNTTAVQYQKEKTIQELFEEQVIRTPDNIALVFGEKHLTYRELNSKANCIALKLREKGIKNDNIVGILVNRSIEMIVGILGILKAGGAYLPIDPEYPEDRIRYMIEDSGASALLTMNFLKEKAGFSGETILLDTIDLSDTSYDDLEIINTPQDLAYVIYTSGSTGKPKGVMIEHKALNNFIKGMTETIDFADGKTILALTTISFDIFALETHLPLTRGMKIVIADENEQMDSKLLGELILKNHIDILQMTPSRMQLLMSSKANIECLKAVKDIIIGGEAFPEGLLKELSSITTANIFNVYGPTETTVWSTIKNLTGLNTINIGKPIANTQIYILDSACKLQPVNVIGELCIGGDGLARGYLNRPELTAEKFITNPYTGQRIYRTGDLAVWMSDGELKIAGRVDHQVKIRGYRIELEEIEKQLMSYENIIECVVTARDDSMGNKYLAAYYVSENEVTVSKIRTYLLESLPEYMVPGAYMRLEQLPRTANGKIDRKALPEPAITRPELETEFAEAATENEKILEEIWKSLLKIEQIGVNDNFFEIGGNSLLLVQMHAKIEEIFPGKVSVAKIFAYPTISKLAGFIHNEGRVSEEKEEAVLSDKVDESLNKDIAIIGIHGVFAEAQNIDEYWNILAEGKDCIRELSESRKKDLTNLLIQSGKSSENISYFKCAYMEEIDKFDCGFFDISPKEASFMDPNQRLFLQTAWKAVEDSGYGGKLLEGTNTGVYVGYSSDFGKEYKEFVALAEDTSASQSVSGNIKSIIASRISYLMDLKGPSIMVDTACSSALTAIHLACQGIRKGECEMAIAGSVKISLTPINSGAGSRIGIESSEGKAKTFDDSSDGTGFGEGVAAILLKPLDRAISDGDNIYAVIKGSAFNQDGASIGLTAPNSAAQEDLLLKAWKDANIDPLTLSYIEAHGTGTKLGDPIEIEGIQGAFRKYTNRKQFCGVGSVKTNIGHLDNAAGIASVIKAVLALKHRQIPPTLHFENPNRKINFEESPVYVNDRLRKWETDGFPRRCGVSSFGLSGTNCHIILEEAPELLKEGSNALAEKLHVLTLSAKSKTVLEEMAKQYGKYLNDKSGVDIEDVCYTANTGRGHYNFRLVISFMNKEELITKLEKLENYGLNNIEESGICYGEFKVIAQQHITGKLGEITEAERKKLSRTAALMLDKEQDNHKLLLENLSDLYIKGADVDWKKLYVGRKNKRISLPTYPFERRRCWIELTKPVTVEADIRKKNIKHPLVDYLLADSINQKVYVTDFSPEKHWVLSEHKIMENCVVPGTTYLEMAREVCSYNYPDKIIRLNNVFFITPLVVNEGDIKEVQTIIKQDEGSIEFIIASKALDGSWLKHVEGSAVLEDKTDSVKNINIEEIKKLCTETVAIDDSSFTRGSMEFGPRWNNAKYALKGIDKVLGYFELPDEFSSDTDDYVIHPALMDCAMNMAIASIGQGLYLPLAYKTLRIFGTMPEKFYCYLRRRLTENGNDTSASFNVTLIDKNGNVFAEAEDYTVKKVNEAESRFRELSGKAGVYYETKWIQQDLNVGTGSLFGERILLFEDEFKNEEKLSALLRNKGVDVITVKSGDSYKKENDNSFIITGIQEDYQALMEEVCGKGLTRIIHMATVGQNSEIKSIENLEEIKRKGVLSLFYLTKALYTSKMKNNIELMLISDYSTEVDGEEKRINPHNAAFLNMGKVITGELPNLSCRCIDLDETLNAEDIYREVLAQQKPYIAAYRSSKRYIEQFKPVNMDENSALELNLKSEGVYIITGGTGGIGLEVAKNLSSKENINLCLVNRTKLPETELWDKILLKNEDTKLCSKINAIQEIERTGTTVICHNADVTNYAQMNELLSLLRSKFGKINGIIHAAGVAGQGFMINKSETVFRNVISPKIDGTWILDKLTENDSMDFFVLFSSITSILGGAGQSDYTAANAYMDSFTYFRNKKMKRTLSVNWAAWKEIGMAVDFGANVDGVFKTISTRDAVKALDEVMGKNIKRVIIAEPNYENEIFENESVLPFKLADEISTLVRGQKLKRSERKIHKVKSKYASVKLEGRENDGYTEMEKQIGRIWGTLLGIDTIDIREDFFTLGGNSLLALKLETELEKENLEIEYSDISSYPTIIELAKFVENKQNGQNGHNSDSVAAVHEKALSNRERSTVTLEEETKSETTENTFLLQNIDPFNDIIYRGCFYSAFFPVLNHYNKSILPFMINEINVYDYMNDGNIKRLDTKYELIESVSNISESLGIKIKSKYNSKNVVNDIIDSLDGNKPVIVCIDCYYESIRPDTYMKTHWPHCLLVYGYDNSEKMFYVLEHRHAGSLIYEKRTISFEDIKNSHNGFVDNYKNLDIMISSYSNLSFKDTETFPAFFEFEMDDSKDNIELPNYSKIFEANMLRKRSLIIDSLDYLKEFRTEFEAVAYEEKALRTSAEQIVIILNSVINAKQAEKYRNAKILNQPEFEELLQKSIDCWEFVRAKVAKFMYASKYKKEAFVLCVEKLTQIYDFEMRYYEGLYSLFADKE